jgi:hypothetical protein
MYTMLSRRSDACFFSSIDEREPALRLGGTSLTSFRTASISAGSRHSTGGIDGIAAQAVITLNLLQTLTPVLTQIGPLMHNFGFVELHSCRIAQGVNGMHFVQQLANTIRAPVRAGTSKQQMAAVYTLTGQTFSGFPGNVSLRQWGLSRDEAVGPIQRGEIE